MVDEATLTFLPSEVRSKYVSYKIIVHPTTSINTAEAFEDLYNLFQLQPSNPSSKFTEAIRLGDKGLYESINSPMLAHLCLEASEQSQTSHKTTTFNSVHLFGTDPRRHHFVPHNVSRLIRSCIRPDQPKCLALTSPQTLHSALFTM